jgi:cystathionine gamma-lyase
VARLVTDIEGKLVTPPLFATFLTRRHRIPPVTKEWGPGTRAVRAGLDQAAQGEPLLAGPVFAAPYHLQGPADASPYAYGRDANPTWARLEAALGGLEGGESVVFASGMAAMSAVLLARLERGDVLVAPHDGYPGVRQLAAEYLEPRGVEVRFVATDTEAVVAAAPGSTLVWVETPANPGLEVCDITAVAEAAHAAGARLAVDNTVATPLGQRPLDLGADFSMLSATKTLGGHSDLLLGAVSVRDPALGADLRRGRTRAGAIPGPFEAWLLHRSLATLELRLERQSANALALARFLHRRPEIRDVRHPALAGHPGHEAAARQMRRYGALVGFTLDSAERAQAFLGALELVVEATSFGGVHSTAERRARWRTDAVAEGFIRFSAGCEDADDLLADVERALDVSE